MNRRRFLKSSAMAGVAATGLPLLGPASLLAHPGAPGPNSRIGVGCIGVGPQGRGVMGNFLAQADCRVLAVCDVSGRNLEAARKMVNEKYGDGGCAVTSEYRELLGRKDIDVVLIATPDHWHVPVAVAAARAGKDMYVEKPLGLSIEEDQRLRRVCQGEKRIFQFGTQQRSQSQFRQACELVRSGRIGALRQINVWCSASHPGGSTKPVPAPADLKYDLWLGPAPEAPYTDGKAYDNDPAGTWKTWWFNYDYALGFIAGWGVHPLDIAYWGHPAMMKGVLEVEGRAVIPAEGACNTSVAWDVNFRFADGVRMTYRGVRNGYEPVTPMNDLTPWEKRYGRAIDHGTAFEGTDGWVLVDRGAIRAFPESLLEEKAVSGAGALPRSNNHVRNLLDAVRSRQPAICPIEDTVQADILCHLSDIATREPRLLRWNPGKEEFVGDAAANRRLKMRPVRKGWQWA